MLAEKWIAHFEKIPQIKEMEYPQIERAKTFLSDGQVKNRKNLGIPRNASCDFIITQNICLTPVLSLKRLII